MSNETQHTPADVRERIIRASILPFEDENTMLAGLRAGAEAVERGELDVDDFVGVWSQYLRELFRRASSGPAPADVRERVAKAVYLWEATRFGAAESWALRSWEQESNTRRKLYFNVADRIIALLRTPRGEGDVKPLAWRVEYRGRTGGEWEYLNTYDLVEVAKEKVERMRRGGVRLEYRIVPLYPAAFRSEAQGEDRWEDLIFSTLIEAYNEAHAALRDGAQGEG